MSKDKMTLKGKNETSQQIKELSSAKWEQVTFQSGPTAFITGIGKVQKTEVGVWSETFLETILPETDEEYDIQLPRITAITEMACNAINNTYGAGINPNHIPDLLRATEMLLKLCNGLLSGTAYRNADETISFAKVAIEKAKL